MEQGHSEVWDEQRGRTEVLDSSRVASGDGPSVWIVQGSDAVELSPDGARRAIRELTAWLAMVEQEAAVEQFVEP